MTSFNPNVLKQVRPELTLAIQSALHDDGKIKGAKETAQIAFAAVADGDLTETEKQVLRWIENGSTSDLVRFFKQSSFDSKQISFPESFTPPIADVGQAILRQAEEMLASQKPLAPILRPGKPPLVFPSPGQKTDPLFLFKPLDFKATSLDAMVKKTLQEAIASPNKYALYQTLADLGSVTSKLTDTSSHHLNHEIMAIVLDFMKGLPREQKSQFQALLKQMALGVVPADIKSQDQTRVKKFQEALDKLKPAERKGLSSQPMDTQALQHMAWMCIAAEQHEFPPELQDTLITKFKSGQFSVKDAIALGEAARHLPADQQKLLLAATQSYFTQVLPSGSAKDKEKAAFALSRLAETTRNHLPDAIREDVMKIAESSPTSNTALRLSTARMFQWKGPLSDFGVDAVASDFQNRVGELLKNPPPHLKAVVEKYKAASSLEQIRKLSPDYYDSDALELIPQGKDFLKMAKDLWDNKDLQVEIAKCKAGAIQKALGKNEPKKVAEDLAKYILDPHFQRRLRLLPTPMRTELMQHELRKLQLLNPELAQQTAQQLSAVTVKTDMTDTLKQATTKDIEKAITQLLNDKNKQAILTGLGMSKEMLGLLNGLSAAETHTFFTELAVKFKTTDWLANNPSKIFQELEPVFAKLGTTGQKLQHLMKEKGVAVLNGLAATVGLITTCVSGVSELKDVPGFSAGILDFSTFVGESAAKKFNLTSGALNKQPPWLNALKGAGLVAAKFATIVDVMSLAECINRKDVGGAIGQGVKVVGGMVGTAAAGLWLLGAASAGPVGWVAGGIVAIGMAIDALFSDSAEEKEVKKHLDTLGISY